MAAPVNTAGLATAQASSGMLRRGKRPITGPGLFLGLLFAVDDGNLGGSQFFQAF